MYVIIFQKIKMFKLEILNCACNTYDRYINVSIEHLLQIKGVNTVMMENLVRSIQNT